jgi:hypothetical protein
VEANVIKCNFCQGVRRLSRGMVAAIVAAQTRVARAREADRPAADLGSETEPKIANRIPAVAVAGRGGVKIRRGPGANRKAVDAFLGGGG